MDDRKVHKLFQYKRLQSKVWPLDGSIEQEKMEKEKEKLLLPFA